MRNNTKEKNSFFDEYQDEFKINQGVESKLIYSGGMPDTPFISIMIPTYRRPELLREAILSALNQTTTIRYEIVVVDNEQSPLVSEQIDELITSFSSANLYLYRNMQNIGMFGNWNRCVELARGEWLTILNDDDKLHPMFLERIKKHLTGMSLVSVGADHFGSKYRKRGAVESLIKRLAISIRNFSVYPGGKREIKISDMFFGNPVTAGLGVVMNKEACLSLGGYRQNLWPIADYVFAVMYCLKFGGINLCEKLASYRIEDNASLKPETVVGFVKMNSLFRGRMIEYVSTARWVRLYLRWLSKILRKFQADYYLKIYLNNQGSAQLYGEVNVSSFPIPCVLYVMYLLKFMVAISFLFIRKIKPVGLR